MTEILSTLKEADSRYAQNVEHLGGGGWKVLRSDEDRAKKEAASKRTMLENVPPGITISRLEYPVHVNSQLVMSNVILLGVK